MVKQFVYSLQITCTAGALVPTPVCLGDSCTVPKLQNGEYNKVSTPPTLRKLGRLP